MKTIIKISLSDAERSHISNIYHNNSSSKLASRKEVTELVQAFVEQLLDGDGQTYKDVAPAIIQHGFKHFINDRQVSAEEFHNPERLERNAQISQAHADERREFFEGGA